MQNFYLLPPILIYKKSYYTILRVNFVWIRQGGVERDATVCLSTPPGSGVTRERGALLNLQWADLDFTRGFISLRGDMVKKQKTETIPMNEQAMAILSGLPQGKSPYVFPGRYDDNPRGNISPMLKRVREKAGLPESFRPRHGLCHSFASWLASSGQVSMYEMQKLLTHSSPQMTQRCAHLHDDALKKASGVAGALFSAVQNMEAGPLSSQEPEKTVEVKVRSKKRQTQKEGA